MRKVAAWVPVSLEMLRELEPVHVEGGRCALMAAAHATRSASRRPNPFTTVSMS